MLWEYESAEPCGAYDATDRAISSLGYRSPTGPEVGQVYACLYLNPWPDRPYGGALTKLPTFRFENGNLRESSRGAPLHKLLKLRLRDIAMWE